MYKEGMRVVMTEDAHSMYGTYEDNPVGVQGVVLGRNSISNGWYDVEWDNGGFNSYQDGDLIVVSE